DGAELDVAIALLAHSIQRPVHILSSIPKYFEQFFGAFSVVPQSTIEVRHNLLIRAALERQAFTFVVEAEVYPERDAHASAHGCKHSGTYGCGIQCWALDENVLLCIAECGEPGS